MKEIIGRFVGDKLYMLDIGMKTAYKLCKINLDRLIKIRKDTNWVMSLCMMDSGITSLYYSFFIHENRRNVLEIWEKLINDKEYDNI